MGRGLVGAIAGGALGAVIWGVLAYLTEREFGLIAWAIGGLVGAGAVMLGGRGKTLAIACGVIAAASILGGKFVMAVFVLDSGIQSEIEKKLAEDYNTNLHEELTHDAAGFAALSGPEDHEAFMISHGYADGGTVSADSLTSFRSGTAQLLQRWGTNMPPIDVAREQYVAHMAPIWSADVRQNVSHADVLKESFGFMDLLFFGLGVFTAFSIVARKSDEEAVPPGPPPMPGPQAPPGGSGT